MCSIGFDAKRVKDECVQWIRDWFEKNGKGCKAVIGISGGKDSTVAAALCIEALGKDRIFGVLMPNYTQDDLSEAEKVVSYLDIDSTIVNIGGITTSFYHCLEDLAENPITGESNHFETTSTAEINLPPRIRMAMLYFISQSINGRVVNTCNKSEDWVGYATKYGDAAGDFSPLSNLLVSEVKAIGYELGLPMWMIEKTPSDGLCGKSDEDSLGFTYKMLDEYIGRGIEPPAEIKERIDRLHEQNLFKLLPMAAFEPKSAD
ncbi:MAG: NAD(+) synthase [Acetobacter sp.]|nr:NAD(+) synthase [Acetobacter sp.]